MERGSKAQSVIDTAALTRHLGKWWEAKVKSWGAVPKEYSKSWSRQFRSPRDLVFQVAVCILRLPVFSREHQSPATSSKLYQVQCLLCPGPVLAIGTQRRRWCHSLEELGLGLKPLPGNYEDQSSDDQNPCKSWVTVVTYL